MRQGEYRAFFEGPLCNVVTAVRDDHKYPEVRVKADNLLVYFQLCENGYADSVAQAREMTAREVIQAMNRLTFKTKFEAAFWELNK